MCPGDESAAVLTSGIPRPGSNSCCLLPCDVLESCEVSLSVTDCETSACYAIGPGEVLVPVTALFGIDGYCDVMLVYVCRM